MTIGNMDADKPDKVRIHINREDYRSPNPTTGEALYVLAGIPEDEKLYREVGGDKEDKLVPRDDAHAHLTKDEHFYSQKAFQIFVNEDEHDVDEKHISYAKVIALYLATVVRLRMNTWSNILTAPPRTRVVLWLQDRK
jgi:hypothetical protein